MVLGRSPPDAIGCSQTVINSDHNTQLLCRRTAPIRFPGVAANVMSAKLFRLLPGERGVLEDVLSTTFGDCNDFRIVFVIRPTRRKSPSK